MSKECEIIRDLLPLYAEGLTSEASNEFVEKHLKDCAECTELLKDMREEPQPQPLKEESELPLKALSKTWHRKNRSLAVLIAGIAASVLISLYAWLSAPRYLTYEQAVAKTEETQNGVRVFFTDAVVFQEGIDAARKVVKLGISDALVVRFIEKDGIIGGGGGKFRQGVDYGFHLFSRPTSIACGALKFQSIVSNFVPRNKAKQKRGRIPYRFWVKRIEI